MSEQPKEMVLSAFKIKEICNAFINLNYLIASSFYIFHHDFRIGNLCKWCEEAYAGMELGGGW